MKFTTSTVVLRQLDEKQGEVLVVCSFCSLVFTEHKGSSLKGGKRKKLFYVHFVHCSNHERGTAFNFGGNFS